MKLADIRYFIRTRMGSLFYGYSVIRCYWRNGRYVNKFGVGGGKKY